MKDVDKRLSFQRSHAQTLMESAWNPRALKLVLKRISLLTWEVIQVGRPHEFRSLVSRAIDGYTGWWPYRTTSKRDDFLQVSKFNFVKNAYCSAELMKTQYQDVQMPNEE